VREQLGVTEGAPYILADLERSGRKLQDWFFHIGRPRAEVTLSVVPKVEGDPHHVVAEYVIEEHQEVHIGKVVVRGNFRTRRWVILEELGFHEGDLLTDDLYSRGQQRLQSTGLFSSLRFEIPAFDTGSDETVDVVVHVEERNDVKAFVDFEAGYSSIKSVYGKVGVTAPNWQGVGVSGSLSGTLGRDFQSADFVGRIPRWLTRRALRIGPDVEVAGFVRQQDTERFGTLQSAGGSLALSRLWQRTAGEGHSARSIAATLRYDFRFRNIRQDTVRIAGNAGEVSSSSVKNRTGLVGVSLAWDQRVDARGNLNPLSPDRGFKLEGGVGLAAGKYFLGQDQFIKVNALGQWIRQLSKRLQLRIEGRFDEGIPLGGAVLLPEVERFFAGGDDTVRGFPQDRLATEVVEEPLPPFDDITQIRVLPAGGNIRMLGTIDLQVRLWQLSKSIPVASALFVDAGVITNTYKALGPDDVRPAVGVALARILTPFGGLSFEWAVPMFPRAVDPPLGRFHIVVALRY
jgi:outer membrane protein assembly factor BamA